MRTGSLRLRLFGLAVVTISVALGLAWLGLTFLFERHVRERVETELANQALWFAANIRMDGSIVSVRQEHPDPRFGRPFGGSYWQIEPEGGTVLRSRSLWDAKLPPADSGGSANMAYRTAGPNGAPILLRSEWLALPSSAGVRRVYLSVATDYTEIDKSVAAFGRELAAALTLMGLLLTTGAAIQVGVGLAPLGSLRNRITEIRMRRSPQLDPNVPREVRPLVEELNKLLAQQGDALVRARAQASDLAHGLKTPLTVLSSVARRLIRSGQREDGEEILAQASMMRRRIDRQLARARLNIELATPTHLAPLVERMVRMMTQTAEGEPLQWELTIDPRLTVAADEVDTAEALGNILENAAKWAKRRVLVTATQSEDALRIDVEDDGPGVAPERRQFVLDRGTKLDDEGGGSGLGLAIVSDIVSAYDGSVELSHSPLGGLRVSITLPCPPEGDVTATRKPG